MRRITVICTLVVFVSLFQPRVAVCEDISSKANFRDNLTDSSVLLKC
ncbi:MAG: hypothetical protein HGA95_03130, partial [Caldiserica bacterium]|nr:hypothetical protein [Caldisericota bacterium]